MHSIPKRLSGAACAVVLCCSIARAQPGVGEPTGTFGIRITHGATVVVDNAAVTVPADVKITDGDPEGSVQIGEIGGAPVILKIVSDDDPSFRYTHWYISVPASLLDINRPGAISLFDPDNTATIDVEVTDLAFINTIAVTPIIFPNETFLAAFMRDVFGVFYDLPGGRTIASSGGPQVQVPGARFCDADFDPYLFSNCDFSTIGTPTATWAWRNIPNPGRLATTATGGASAADGFVFELALAVAFDGLQGPVPQPITGGVTPRPTAVPPRPPPIADPTCGAGSWAALPSLGLCFLPFRRRFVFPRSNRRRG